mgnify:CR=1 FL=1
MAANKQVLKNPQPSILFTKFNDSSIKYFIYDDNIYFKAKDVTIILGYEDTNQTIRKNVNPNDKIILDPAIGFFRKTGQGQFFTKIKSDWIKRDLSILQNLKSIKQNFPILISVSNKSFIGNILEFENPADRLFGSIAVESISVINGADIIRTHNVGATRDAIIIASNLLK